ncbi:phage tail protein, partial [Enterococcus pseudoavium]|nr:phage tail protein [Enterococcus pseudoavium]
DPRKYTREFSITREVKSDLPYGAIPTSIIFEATQDKNVSITNGRETISITNSAIKTGDKVEILIKQG